MRTALGAALALLISCSPAAAVVSATDIGTATNTSGSTVSLVTTATAPSGSTIVICADERSNSQVYGSASDGANTYNHGGIHSSGTSNTTAILYYAYNVSTLTSGSTITYTKGNSGTHTALSAFYLTGLRTGGDPESSFAFGAGSTATTSATSGSDFSTHATIVGCVGSQGQGGLFVQDSSNGAWATPPTEAKTGTGSGDARVDGGWLSTTIPGGGQIYAPTFFSAVPWVTVLGTFKEPLPPNGFIFSPNVIP